MLCYAAWRACASSAAEFDDFDLKRGEKEKERKVVCMRSVIVFDEMYVEVHRVVVV